MQEGGAGMQLKKLKPTLPKDAQEILDKGFEGNVSKSKKFITDGHSIVLVSEADADMVADAADKKREDYSGVVKEKSIQELWDDVSGRKRQPAEFIGCVNVGKDAEGAPIIIAVIRSKDKGIVGVNPWKLKWCLSTTKADGIAVATAKKWQAEPMTILRGETVVGIIMPMRYTESDLCEYDLTGEAAAL